MNWVWEVSIRSLIEKIITLAMKISYQILISLIYLLKWCILYIHDLQLLQYIDTGTELEISQTKIIVYPIIYKITLILYINYLKKIIFTFTSEIILSSIDVITE